MRSHNIIKIMGTPNKKVLAIVSAQGFPSYMSHLSSHCVPTTTKLQDLQVA